VSANHSKAHTHNAHGTLALAYTGANAALAGAVNAIPVAISHITSHAFVQPLSALSSHNIGFVISVCVLQSNSVHCSSSVCACCI
jgi:hypothetical protein